jgi:hypothetical protein
VRRGVAALLPLVGGLGEHGAVRTQDHGADRGVAPLDRGGGQFERPAHRGVDHLHRDHGVGTTESPPDVVTAP